METFSLSPFSSPRTPKKGSPRDDRFYTPRVYANNNNSSDGEFVTARGSARSNGLKSRTSSEDDFSTPRGDFDANSRQRRQSNTSNLLTSSSSIYSSPRQQQNNYNVNGQQYFDNRSEEKSSYNEYSNDNKGEGGQYAGYQNQSPIGFKRTDYKNDRDGYYNNSGNRNNISNNNNVGLSNTSIPSTTYDHTKDNSYDDAYSIPGSIEEEPSSNEDIDDLFRFARHGRCDEIDRILNKGIPIDVRDEYGSSLLIIACQNGNKRVAKLVLRRGANINGRNNKGNTALHYCNHFGYGEISYLSISLSF
jgi:ankyrin repeat protein